MKRPERKTIVWQINSALIFSSLEQRPGMPGKQRNRRTRVADLSDVFLENTVLAQCDLRNADFRATHFWRCSLIGADFHGADLRQAHFWQCSLTQANLSGANLSDAWFIRATLKDVNLNNATLTGADFIESTR